MNTNKTLYGIMAFGPLALIFVSLLLLFGGIAASDMGGHGRVPNGAGIFLIGFFGLIVIGSILSIVSMVMYLIHISKNPSIPEDQRILWILGIVFLNGIVNIVYFFVYITKEDDLPAPPHSKSPWE